MINYTIIPLLLSLSLIKSFERVPTYFQLIYIIIGAFVFLKNYNTLLKKTPLIYCILVINFLITFFTSPPPLVTEYIQIVSLIGVSYWITTLKDYKKFFKNYSYSTLILSTFISAHNFFISNFHFGYRYFNFPRIGGIVGEPNFSAFALSLPLLYFLKGKKWLPICLILLNLLLLQSRSALIFLIFLIFFTFIYSLNFLSKNLKCMINKYLFIFIFMSPFVISGIYNAAGDSHKKILVKKLSTRFYLNDYYLSLGLANPLGVGLQKGQKYYKEKGESFRIKTSKKLRIKWIERAEQHSLFLQVISEFGIIIYFILFLIILKYDCLHNSYTLNSILVMLVFTNGLNELTLFIGFIYAYLQNKDLNERNYTSGW